MTRKAYSALKHRDYRMFSAGLTLSVLGEQMLDVAIGWEVYQRTNSASALGLIGLAEAVPFMTLAPFGGQVADRFSRRNVLVLVQIVVALCSLSLAAVSHLQAPVGLTYFIVAIAGAARAFKSPARSSLLPALVPRADLASAISWNSSMFEIACMTGPMIGGFALAAWKSFPLVYGFNAALALSLLVAMLLIEPRPAPAGAKGKIGVESLLAGFRYLGRTPMLLSAITLDLLAVLLGGATALLPMFAKDILHVDATGLGWLRAAPAIGAFTMAMAVPHLSARFSPLKHAGPALLAAVTGFGLATIVFGLSTNFWLSAAALYLIGAFDNVSVVIRSTMLQLFTPDDMRGRVSAVNYIFIGASNELGAFESGIAAAAFGPVIAVAGGGVGTLLVVLAVLWKWPELVKLRELDGPGPK